MRSIERKHEPVDLTRRIQDQQSNHLHYTYISQAPVDLVEALQVGVINEARVNVLVGAQSRESLGTTQLQRLPQLPPLLIIATQGRYRDAIR
jgi:hypothetical protein